MPKARRSWLFKSEPEVFSIDDLARAPRRTAFWDGVRNYQARNLLRDEIQVGDGIVFYHSNAEPPAAVGLATVVGPGRPDPSQFDPASDHHDPGATPDAPRWYGVDVRFDRKFKRPLSLDELRGVPALADMVLLRKGSRLSVQPVSAAEWKVLCRLGGAG